MRAEEEGVGRGEGEEVCERERGRGEGEVVKRHGRKERGAGEEVGSAGKREVGGEGGVKQRVKGGFKGGEKKMNEKRK